MLLKECSLYLTLPVLSFPRTVSADVSAIALAKAEALAKEDSKRESSIVKTGLLPTIRRSDNWCKVLCALVNNKGNIWKNKQKIKPSQFLKANRYVAIGMRKNNFGIFRLLIW